jgi:putrescine:ornithine antiporter
MAAVTVIMKKANVAASATRVYTFFALVGAVYSFYALYSTGTMEVFYGSIITFLGWTFWGFVAPRFYRQSDAA